MKRILNFGNYTKFNLSVSYWEDIRVSLYCGGGSIYTKSIVDSALMINLKIYIYCNRNGVKWRGRICMLTIFFGLCLEVLLVCGINMYLMAWQFPYLYTNHFCRHPIFSTTITQPTGPYSLTPRSDSDSPSATSELSQLFAAGRSLRTYSYRHLHSVQALSRMQPYDQPVWVVLLCLASY